MKWMQLHELSNSLCGWAVLLLVCLGSPATLAESDKRLHAATAYGISFTTSQLVRHACTSCTRYERALIGFTTTMILGIGKEFLIDEKPDGGDVIANGVGAGLGAIVSISIDF